MAYSDKVIDHYENPRNVGTFNKDDSDVGTGMVGAPACGDVMRLQIKVNDAGIIEDAKFKTYGCGSAIASSSLITEWVKGQPEDQVFEQNGVKVFIDPKSMVYLDGTQVDFAKEGLQEGFKFENPNAKESCGCGESFHV